MTDLSADHRRVRELNMRLQWDGMRAYHTSEIAHKGHTIAMLQTVLAVVVPAYAALAVAALAGSSHGRYLAAAAMAFWLITVVMVVPIVALTNRKIQSDNRAFETYRTEWIAEREQLGLVQSLTENAFTSGHTSRAANQKTGYKVTQQQMAWMGAAVVMGALIATILVVVLAVIGKPLPASDVFL